MSSRSPEYEEYSNGDSKGNDTSMIVNVNDTRNDSDNENDESSSMGGHSDDRRSRDSNDSKNWQTKSKSSPARDPKIRPKKIDPNTSRYLWLSGIPAGTKSGQLAEIFQGHGKVIAIKIIRGDNNTLLGFVKLENIEQANRCMEKLDKCDFRGNRLTISKERPISKEKDDKVEKIGFRSSSSSSSSRKYESSKPYRGGPPTSSYKPFRSHFRGGPIKSIASKFNPRRTHQPYESRRPESREALDFERERQKLKFERMKLERERAELKFERESRLDRDRIPSYDDKRIPPVKRTRSEATSSFLEPSSSSYISEKRFDDFNRRDDFSSSRRYESSSSSDTRKFNQRSFSSSTTRPRFEEHNTPRQERFQDTKHDSSRNWQVTSKTWNSTPNTTSGTDRWPSSIYDNNGFRMLANLQAAPPVHRSLHSTSTDLSSHISTKSDMRHDYFRSRY